MRRVPMLAILTGLCVPGLALAAAPATELELKPCAGIPDLPPEARCGTYEVWENRAAKTGRKIPLRVVVLPAQGPDRQPDPLVFLNGGPGDSNVEAASWLAAELKEINQRRDLLLVDFRGTGGSGGLFCPEMETSAGLQGYLDHYLAPDQAKACAERLAKTADLSQYTNDTTVDDLDEVRAALGYEKVNLMGGSGGSRTGLIYLRRHPESVRAAILSGLVPTDERGPFFMARHVQRALDGRLAECDRDEACRAAFPKVREELATMLQRAAEKPAVVTLTDGETGKPLEVRLTRNALITTLRAMLYSSTGASRIPFSVHQAVLGNWMPMAEAAQAAGSGLSTMARGYYLSLTCSEDVPFIPEEEVPAVVRGSFLGDYRIRAQQAACAAWPVPPVGREFQEPVTSDVPTLLISGELDPVTPPSNAERAARTLKNSLHVVIPHTGHSLDGLETMGCLTDLMTRFVEAGTAKGLDGSCLAKTKPPAFAREAQPAAKLALKPCTTIPGLPPEARCGTYEVWENRAAKTGRKIPLRVVVLPATGPDRLSDPFVYFTGGPGNSSVSAAASIAAEFGALRKRRDILLVDFRGTGGSGGLFCPEMVGGAGAQGFLDEFYPPEKVKTCAERLAKTADLSQYTNAASVDDIEEVRAALGYGKLNIYGASGGTKSALVYLRRYPDNVRTVVLHGVAPTDERGPFPMARHAQRALDSLIAECEGDPACRTAFPHLRDEAAAVLRQIEKQPVTVTLTDGETGKPVDVRLARNGVATTFRYMLYSPRGASLLPLSIHFAAQGDWKPMAEAARRFSAGSGGALADGYYLSLTCAEDLPFIREEEIPAAVQGTFLGDFRIRKQQAACAAWPVPAVGREFLDPTVSDVPALLLSGERDPVTPPSNAERAARTLKNSLQVVVPDGGHSFGSAYQCVDSLIVRFVEAGTVKGLDTSCVEKTKRPEFVLKRDPDVELPADQIARFTGTYKDGESGYEIRVQAAGNRLLAVLVDEESNMVLVPTSPTRFRIEGMTDTMTFQLGGGVATLLWEAPGLPSLTLKREGP
ncbi:MAG TPA: alpha/beta fold hydrolase [Thermoanaerobaculia bacterium]